MYVPLISTVGKRGRDVSGHLHNGRDVVQVKVQLSKEDRERRG